MKTPDKYPHVPIAWQDSLPVTSRYTVGLAGERFFRSIKDEGRIMGTYCPECDRTYVPAAIFCERCMSKLDQWVDVGTTGEIHTFTLLYTNYDGTPREDPEAIVLVKFGDGGLIHRLAEVDLEKVSIGMEVEAVFKPAAERQGSILDISHFRPLKE
jgi:uncharacterized OB-fold protein